MNGFHFHFQPPIDEKDRSILRKAGFDSREMARLCELKRGYKPEPQSLRPLSWKHLLFARWLVRQGKLNEFPSE